MAKLEFLRAVLADEGFYCVVGLDKKKKDGGKGRTTVQKFYKNLEDAIKVAEELSENGYNTYYALSTFKEGNSREADNAQYIKALFLDIDYGDVHGKPSVYKSYDEVIAALKQFCRTLHMPRPALISSGGGVHAYWPLAEKVAPHEWFPVAARLKELCLEHSLAADAAVTSDCARILRVPGTSNYRADEPRDVVITQYAKEAHPLSHYIEILGESDKTFLSTLKGSADELTESLSGDSYPDCSFKRILVRTVQGDGCEQLRNVYENQESIDEPVWVAGLSITKFCIEEKANYRISSRHPGFSEAEMEDKLSRLSKPMGCDKFNERNPGVCGECPHWGKIKTPIVLGKIVQEAPPKTLNEIQAEYEEAEAVADAEASIDTESEEVGENPGNAAPTIPFPYFRGANGGIYKRVQSGEGIREQLVLENDLFVVRRQEDSEKGTCAVLQRFLPKDGMREFTVPLSVVGTTDEFRKTLNHFGVASMDTKEVGFYVMKVVGELQKACKSGTAHRRFGWTDNTLSEFVLGRYVYKHNKISGGIDTLPNAPTSVTDKYFAALAPKGSRAKCIEILEFFNSPGNQSHQLQIGAGFGAPLMRLTDIHATVFNFWSPDSGVGKTTAMKASAGIWGDPKEIVGKSADTSNARLHKCQVFGDLPNYNDEMTNISSKEASDFILSLTDGQQKDRMKSSSNETRERAAPWFTLCVATGNASISERAGGMKHVYAAEDLRVFTDRVLPVQGLSKVDTDILSKDIQDNYGHIGPEYVAYLLENRDQIREEFRATRTKIDEALGFDKHHRFYSAGIAAIMMGLRIAKRLGFVNYDLPTLMNWIKVKTKDILDRQEIEHSFDPMNYINRYAAEFNGQMLKIRSTEGLRPDQVAMTDKEPSNTISMRYDRDTETLVLLRDPFKKWCVTNGVGYSALVDELKRRGLGHQDGSYYIGANWGLGTNAKFPVLIVDWRDPDAKVTEAS